MKKSERALGSKLVAVCLGNAHESVKNIACTYREFLSAGVLEQLYEICNELQGLKQHVLRGNPRKGQCCEFEDRDMRGGCKHCGAPCL